MIKLTTVHVRCKKHGIDKKITYEGDPKKWYRQPDLTISSYMAAFGCKDYKTSTRTEEFPS